MNTKKENKIVVLENSPLTPIDGSNPSFRYMYLNSTTSQIIDYQQAYVNLSAVVSNVKFFQISFILIRNFVLTNYYKGCWSGRSMANRI